MSQQAPAELTAHLGYWLRMVSNHVSHAFAARLADRGVTVAEWVMMRCLYDREPMQPSRIALEMGMTRGAITRLGDRLIAKSLVVRAARPQDGRTHTLALSGQGAALVPGLAALADRNEAEFFGRLSQEERERLETTLKRLVTDLGISAMPTQ